MLFSIAVEQITLNTGQIILGITSGTVVAIYVIAIQFTKIYHNLLHLFIILHFQC